MRAPGDGHGERRRRSWSLNPYEIAVCGYKNSGKTTLLEGIARALAGQLRLGYLKHDAHAFTMDRPGKDTDRLREAGAHCVLIDDGHGFAHLGRHDGEALAPFPLLAEDALLVEGYKTSGLPRIMLVDEKVAIADDAAWQESAPVAAVHPWREGHRENAAARALVTHRFGEIPWFSRDDVAGVTAFIRERWRQRTPRLQGLLLTGGQSTRMGRDKALLDYHGCTQVDYGVRVLRHVCAEVWVSCRPDQDAEMTRRRHPTLPDRFLDMGPAGGILSALARDQRHAAAWLVLACDLPRVDLGVVQGLVSARNPFRFATAFCDAEGLPEPLCAIWEPKAYPRLLQFLGMGYECPRKCLMQSSVQLAAAPTPHALDNGNSPQDLSRIRDDLNLAS